MGFSPWEIWVAFPGESQLQQSCATQPTVHAECFSVSIIHRTLTWTTGSLTCAQMLMQAITHGVTDTHKRVCTESWLWEKNSLPHQGIEPVSVVWRSDALANSATFPFLCLEMISASPSEQHHLCGLSKSTHTPGLLTAGWYRELLQPSLENYRGSSWDF